MLNPASTACSAYLCRDSGLFPERCRVYPSLSATKMLFYAPSAPHPSASIHHLGMSAVSKQTPASLIKAFPDNDADHIVSQWQPFIQVIHDVATHCVTAGAQTGCDPWPWCCSSSGGCGTGAGTPRSSPLSRSRWPASPWDAGGTAGAACSPDRGCCRTSPGSPGYPCTCRGEPGTHVRGAFSSRK